MTDAAAMKALAAQWFAAFPNLTDAIFADVIDPRIVNHPAAPPMREGIDNFKRVIRYVLAAAPDQTYRCEEQVAEGDLVVTRTRWAGAFTGEYLGVPGNGRRFDVGQYHTFRVADGKFVEHWAVRDDLEVFRQTGVAPPG